LLWSAITKQHDAIFLAGDAPVEPATAYETVYGIMWNALKAGCPAILWVERHRFCQQVRAGRNCRSRRHAVARSRYARWRSDAEGAGIENARLTFARRVIRLWTFFLAGMLSLGAVLWIAWQSRLFISAVLSEQEARRAAKAIVEEGRLPAVVPRSNNLRGEQNVDYWCFGDGACFYSVDRFGALYPSYNDLDDDEMLIAELERELGGSMDIRERLMNWQPFRSYSRAVALPLLLLASMPDSLWRLTRRDR
jgi:hypothetical protein